VCSLCATTVLGGGTVSETAAPPRDFRIRLRDSHAGVTLRSALTGAARRLEVPECGRIFADFSDERGRSLEDRLADLGVTGPGYLALVVFVDGAAQPQCQRSNVLAFTETGSRVIHVCPGLTRLQRRDSQLAQAVIIHEALHSLGFGENPPASVEITRRVLDRCAH
jgi:hypothetical protein